MTRIFGIFFKKICYQQVKKSLIWSHCTHSVFVYLSLLSVFASDLSQSLFFRALLFFYVPNDDDDDDYDDSNSVSFRHPSWCFGLVNPFIFFGYIFKRPNWHFVSKFNNLMDPHSAKDKVLFISQVNFKANPVKLSCQLLCTTTWASNSVRLIEKRVRLPLCHLLLLENYSLCATICSSNGQVVQNSFLFLKIRGKARSQFSNDISPIGHFPNWTLPKLSQLTISLSLTWACQGHRAIWRNLPNLTVINGTMLVGEMLDWCNVIGETIVVPISSISASIW